MTDDRQPTNERLIVLLLGAVQFVNILDFVMVMPLGPDFAKALGIPASKLGFIGGSYTAAAAVSGVIGSFFLDRFDRRPALALALLGLTLGTFAGGLATGMATLMLARVVAGTFGGPATSLAFSILADIVPPERRGKAVGAVMAAFSVASVVGVPIGLELAARGGWRMPFYTTAALGLTIDVCAYLLLPPMRGHLAQRGTRPPPRLADIVSRREVRLSYTMTALVMASGFLLIPNLSAYVQENLHFPRNHLGSLYLGGGVVSFFATRYGGRVVDRFGSFRTGTAGVVWLVAVQFVFFIVVPRHVPVIFFFMSFMLGLGLRNVSYNTLTSKVPSAEERARFMSIQSAVQHASSALGAFVAAQMLSEVDQALVGMKQVALLSMSMTLLVPLMLWQVERRVAPRLR